MSFLISFYLTPHLSIPFHPPIAFHRHLSFHLTPHFNLTSTDNIWLSSIHLPSPFTLHLYLHSTLSSPFPSQSPSHPLLILHQPTFPTLFSLPFPHAWPLTISIAIPIPMSLFICYPFPFPFPFPSPSPTPPSISLPASQPHPHASQKKHIIYSKFNYFSFDFSLLLIGGVFFTFRLNTEVMRKTV